MRAAIVASLALAACSDLPDLGTCGNGIVEADLGEACDGDLAGEDTCSDTCELSCQTSAVSDAYVVVPSSETDERFCPDTRMTCGLDGVCRGSSGQFTSVGGAQPFDTKFAVAGDFDGDGIADLIGTSATQIVVRLGATISTSVFTDGFAQAAPSSDSPLAIFDRAPDALNLDSSDMALGVPTDGLALLTSDTEVFGPDLDLTFDVDDAAQVQLVVRDPDPALEGSDVVLAVARLGTLAVQRLAISGAHTQLALPTCGPNNARLLTVAITRDLTSFAVIGKPNVGPGFFICHYTPNGATFQMAQTNINAVPPDTAVFAQLDDDPCLDLAFTRIAGGVPSVVAAPATAGTCAFAGALVAIADLTATDVLLDAGSIVPRAAGIERDELVLASGVYRLEAGVFALVIGPTSEINPWTTAAVVDLNGDGQLDVVAGRKGQDDVDVVRGGAIPNAYRADTTTAVVATSAGDFDGDFLGDVALIETSSLGQRVSILYGSRDGIVGEPVVTSKFSGILKAARLGRATWSGTSRGADGVDDLVVLRTLGQPTRGGILVGDAARIMTVPRIPPLVLVPGDKPPAIGVVAVGRFASGVLAASLRPDLDTTAADSLISTNNIATAVWSDPIVIAGFEVDTLRPPAIVRTPTFGAMVAAFAKPVVVGAGEPAQTTIGLVGIDGQVCTKTLVGTQTSIRAFDVTGDDVDEIIVTVDGGRRVHVFPVTAESSGCEILDEILTEALAECADVANVGDHVIALCDTEGGARRPGIYRIDEDGSREEPPAITLDGVGLELVVGEFDGDGVRDVAVKLGRAAEVSVQFLKQCPAHDVRGCR